MELTRLEPQETEEITAQEKRALEFLQYAENMQVTDQEERDLANDEKTAGWDRYKKVQAFMRPLIKKAREPYTDLLDKEKALLTPLDQGTKVLAGKILAFDEEKKRLAEKRKAELMAQEAKERRERKALEDKRLEEEQKKKEEEAKAEQARLMKLAEEKEEQGNTAMANLLVDSAAKVEAEPVKTVMRKEPETATQKELKQAKVDSKIKTGGTKRWSFTATNIDEIPRAYLLDGDELFDKQIAKINMVIKAHKGKINIPGIEIEEELGARR